MSAVGPRDLVVALVTVEGRAHLGCRTISAGLVYRCRAVVDLSTAEAYHGIPSYWCDVCGIGDQTGITLEGDPGDDSPESHRTFWCLGCELRALNDGERDKIEKLRELNGPPSGFEEPKRVAPVRARPKEKV